MTDSPFLPNSKLQYAWDSTSLGYLKQCPRLYQYIMIEGWTPKDESIHLRFGTEYHTALEDYDRYRAGGLDHDESLYHVVWDLILRTEEWDPDPTLPAGKKKNRKTLLRSVIGYLDLYRDDACETYIRPDGQPAVELTFSFNLDFGPDDQPYMLCGHLDRVVTFNGEVFGMDHKTTSGALTDYYFNQFEPNNQMTLYTLATKVVLNANVKGIIIDAAKLNTDETQFARRFTYRTPDQLEEWLRDLRTWLAMAERYATEGYWPQNDTACDKYGGCRFREICSKSPQVREKFLEANFTRASEEEKWNPLRTR